MTVQTVLRLGIHIHPQTYEQQSNAAAKVEFLVWTSPLCI